MKRILFSIYTVCSLLLVSCSEENEVEEILSDDRVILVYLGRDNDLAGLHEDKITSILEGWNGKHGKLIFYQDVAKQKPALLEAIRLNGENTTRVIEEYEEENSASAEVFSRVQQRVMKLYPSDSYGLILFSHGTGFLPEGVYSSPRSIIRDNRNEMEILDFAASIPNNMYDFIIFEACNMAGIEVAYELRHKTDYLLVSSAEIVSPGFKEIYATSINLLFEKTPDIIGFGQAAFDYFNNRPRHYFGGTLSVIKTAGLDQLASWARKIEKQTSQVADVAGIQCFDRFYSFHYYYDFEDYYANRVNDSLLIKNELIPLLNQCVVAKWATDSFLPNERNGFEILKHSGLTIYIPDERYPYINEHYKGFAWYRVTN